MKTGNDAEDSNESAPRSIVRGDLFAVLALVLIWSGLLGPLLRPSSTLVLSHSTGDTSQFFVPMREFAAEEILAGRLPLWNPYLMSGTSFIGNFQSAMFYPLNALYLALPAGLAVNADYALHLLLIALFMYLWARGRGISPPGGFLAAVIVAFSAPVYLRIMAGQVTMIDAMTWAPLLFFAIDRIFNRAAAREPLLGAVLVGTFAVGLQLLAGHPQTVFITGFTAGLYCALRFAGAGRRIRVTAAMLALGAWGFALGAVQLLPGLETMQESLRTGGINAFDFSTTFSFPPENLLNLLAPAFFGDREHLLYWSRWAIWDAAVFIGVTGLALAVYGAKYASPRQRRYAPVLVLLLVFLAMGRYSPVYSVFRIIPVFDALRGVSKFLFPATMFAGILCGLGFDRITADAGTARPRKLAAAALALCPPIAIGMAAIAFAHFHADGKIWREIVFRQMSDGVFAFAWFNPPENFFRDSALFAIGSLGLALALLLILAALLWNLRTSRTLAAALFALAVAEMLGFAMVYRVTFDEGILRDEPTESFYAAHDGDYRVLQLSDPLRVYRRNHPMSVRRPAIWGYEPVMLQRYGMFVASACISDPRQLSDILDHARWGSDIIQVGLNSESMDFNEDPETATADLPAVFDLVRCRYMVVPEGMPHTTPGIYENADAMPRFLFLNDYLVLDSARVILQELNAPSFDPRRRVILEETPNPAPNPAEGPPAGSVTVEDESTDHMTLRVSVDRPAILLVTDAISAGWRIAALEGSAQDAYDILPANFALRGIPLAEGAHHFRMEYRPLGFDRGLQITFVALIAFMAAGVYWGTMTIGGYLAKKAR